MTQNNFNKLSTYEQVYKRLQVMVNKYLSINNGRKIRSFNLGQDNNGDFENRLIEDDLSPDELVSEIKASYLSRDYVQGEIGLIDEEEQYDGIFNIALYTLMTNRVGKMFLHEKKQNSNINKEEKAKYNEAYRNLMLEKNSATIKLIYSLFIYKKTVNDNDFFYGHRIDKDGNDNIVIDLPVYGQISVHFAKKENAKDVLERIKYEATQSTQLILNKKLELGQITKEKYEEIQNKLDKNDVFPEYTGKLYEYSSGIPLDYCGEKFKEAQKHFRLSKKMVNEINNEDIIRISQDEKYNSREIYYFGIKSDFSKQQLEMLSIKLQERDGDLVQEAKQKININELGKEVIEQTTAEERIVVARHEQNIENLRQDNTKVEEIGG